MVPSRNRTPTTFNRHYTHTSTPAARMASLAASSSSSLATFEQLSSGPRMCGEHYKKICKAGSGAYGTVYKAQCLRTGKFVALKRTDSHSTDDGVPATAVREISLLRSFEHENIVRLLDVFLHPQERCYLVFEWAKTDLSSWLKKRRKAARPMSMGLVKDFTHQLFTGILYIHSRGIMHRDLKPANILLMDHPSRSGALVLKIADFGLGRAFQVPVRPYTHEVVTLWYRCPEILLGTKKYSCGVDTWSAGCIMAQFANMGIAPFTANCEIGLLMKIFKALGTPKNLTRVPEPEDPNQTQYPHLNPEFPNFQGRGVTCLVKNGGLDPNGLHLLSRLLEYDPSKRIPITDALQHPWFDNLAECQESAVSDLASDEE